MLCHMNGQMATDILRNIISSIIRTYQFSYWTSKLWKWGLYDPPKRRKIFARRQYLISQNTQIFIKNALWVSNIPRLISFGLIIWWTVSFVTESFVFTLSYAFSPIPASFVFLLSKLKMFLLAHFNVSCNFVCVVYFFIISVNTTIFIITS
jgi:hypothetical protein